LLSAFYSLFIFVVSLTCTVYFLAAVDVEQWTKRTRVRRNGCLIFILKPGS